MVCLPVMIVGCAQLNLLKGSLSPWKGLVSDDWPFLASITFAGVGPIRAWPLQSPIILPFMFEDVCARSECAAAIQLSTVEQHEQTSARSNSLTNVA
jgi:hypothetical protein